MGTEKKKSLQTAAEKVTAQPEQVAISFGDTKFSMAELLTKKSILGACIVGSLMLAITVAIYSHLFFLIKEMQIDDL